MAKKAEKAVKVETESEQSEASSSRRSLAAKCLGISENEIMASRELDDGGIVVVVWPGPKRWLTSEQLGEGIVNSEQ